MEVNQLMNDRDQMVAKTDFNTLKLADDPIYNIIIED